MKKINYVIYLCDDELFFLDIKKENIKKAKFKSIKKDELINSSLFIDEFSKFLKQNHIKVSLFGDNICFIKNKNINLVTLEKYEELLKEYFHRIEYRDLEEILKIDTNTAFLNITNHYLDYYFMKKNEKRTLRIELSLFNDQLNKALQHIFSTIFKPKRLMVYGNLENISKIAENITNNYNITTTFPEVHYHYIFEEYKK